MLTSLELRCIKIKNKLLAVTVWMKKMIISVFP